jgi:hypothetical protein
VYQKGPGRLATPGEFPPPSRYPPLISQRGWERYDHAYGAEEMSAALDLRIAHDLVQSLRARAAAIRNDPVMKRYVLLRAFGLARLAGERLAVLRPLAREALPLLGRGTAAELAQRAELLAALADAVAVQWTPEDEELPVVSAGAAADALEELATWQITNGFVTPWALTMARAERYARRAVDTDERLKRLAAIRKRAQGQAWALAKPGVTGGRTVAGDRVVVVVDASGSVRNRFTDVQDLVVRFVESLVEGQAFDVILFQDDEAPTFLPIAVAATAPNKERARVFVRAATAKGGSNPIPALEAAFRLDADTVWLISDGDFPDNDTVLAFLRERNRRRLVNVHVVALVERGEDTYVGVLKAIASENGGDFRYEMDMSTALTPSTAPSK